MADRPAAFCHTLSSILLVDRLLADSAADCADSDPHSCENDEEDDDDDRDGDVFLDHGCAEGMFGSTSKVNERRANKTGLG